MYTLAETGIDLCHTVAGFDSLPDINAHDAVVDCMEEMSAHVPEPERATHRHRWGAVEANMHSYA